MTKTEPVLTEGGLLPCPFCGARDGRLIQAYTRATETFEYWSVECLDCACEIASDSSQEEADASWNRRAPSVHHIQALLEGERIGMEKAAGIADGYSKQQFGKMKAAPPGEDDYYATAGSSAAQVRDAIRNTGATK